MDAEVQTRVTLGAELRIAVDKDQLFLMYQPQIAIDTGRITGMEALVRWRHPQRGVLGPGLFIPIAEQIGIIAKLGHWVLWEACRQGKSWLDAGIAPVRICVNVSALQFRMPVALEADIAAALARISHRRGLVFRDPTMIAQWPWRGRARPWRGLRGWGRSLGVSGGWWVGLPRFFGVAATRQAVVTRRAAASRHSSA
jgi:hypothetical protein